MAAIRSAFCQSVQIAPPRAVIHPVWPEMRSLAFRAAATLQAWMTTYIVDRIERALVAAVQAHALPMRLDVTSAQYQELARH